MTMQQYCLRWNNHQPNFISVFSSLLNSESLVDVTLAAEGRHLQAHKVVLSACSSYFQSLFTINPCQHPIVILKDVKFTDLKVMVDFMYYGEVNVSQEQLPYILKTAEMLKIKGLAEIPVDQSVTRSHNSSVDRAELLAPGETSWNVEGRHLSPSPCPLSPSTKRKRLRKSSTGSGSGSTERTSEDQSGEVTLTPSAGLLGTVIKADQGTYTEGNATPQKFKHHSSDSELHRGSSHESVDSDTPHQITLQVPQQQELSLTPQSLESQASIDIQGPPPSSSQQTVAGYQWNILDGTSYAHYSTCPATNNSHSDNQCVANNSTVNPSSPDVTGFQNHIENSPPQMIQKRKRSVNPQADENFIRALDAVRYGGIGFCKAARMYGVNNRTLWLEYKKRGYPNFRLSIKNRKQEVAQTTDAAHQVSSSPPPEHVVPRSEQENSAPSNPVALMNSVFFENKHNIELAPALQRPKYLDAAMINVQQAINFQGLNFEHM